MIGCKRCLVGVPFIQPWHLCAPCFMLLEKSGVLDHVMKSRISWTDALDQFLAKYPVASA